MLSSRYGCRAGRDEQYVEAERPLLAVDSRVRAPTLEGEGPAVRVRLAGQFARGVGERVNAPSCFCVSHFGPFPVDYRARSRRTGSSRDREDGRDDGWQDYDGDVAVHESETEHRMPVTCGSRRTWIENLGCSGVAQRGTDRERVNSAESTALA